MIVMKFGGTSVENAAAIRNVSSIVHNEVRRKPIVVVSACAGITNQLIQIATLASTGNKKQAIETIHAVRKRHHETAQHLFPSAAQRKHSKKLDGWCNDLSTFVEGISILGELTPRSLDTVTSFGEIMSSYLIHHYMASKKIKSILIDARSFMITDEHFTKAAPQFPSVKEKLEQIVVPALKKHDVVITQGFIGATRSGITTTLGRGGSDYSAAIIGSLLSVDDIQIWTDVDGILTADPSIIKDAKKIKVMSFNEAAELAYFGARVLHPETILPAVKKNIPVHVLNSRNPKLSGTLIVAQPKMPKRCIIKSIAYKEGVTIISIVSTRMFLAHGFLENVFDVFHKYKTIVHTVATSEVSISVTIDNRTFLDAIVKELQLFSTVTVTHKKAIVCVVGENLKNCAGISASVLSSISDVNINMISQGASEINLSFVIDEDDITKVVKQLHDRFFANTAELPDIFE